MLADNWPLFKLRVVTPRVSLVVPTDDILDQLCELAAEGIHGPDEMPFGMPWSKARPPVLQRNTLQYFWRTRATWNVDSWSLPMAVLAGETCIGAQTLHAERFPIIREVGTGSWLGREYHGQGLGKEMRLAVLHLAFDGLGARAANTSAHEDNSASLGVTTSLGYAPNGETVQAPEGEPVRTLRYRMGRPDFDRIRRDDIRIEGLEECLSFFQ